MKTTRLVFVDVEGANPRFGAEPTWTLREFGAVDFESGATFHGLDASRETFDAFRSWLRQLQPEGRLVFVSDNPAYDWPPIHWYFLKYHGVNPFGHSARRIGDFAAGLTGDVRRTSEWKRLRVTPHDHNPVHDAQGNVEAFRALLRCPKPA